MKKELLMPLDPNYKVVSVNDHHNYGANLKQFRSVNVESIPTSVREPIIRNTLFTMENPKVGDELVILKDELTAVLGQMTMFIYRPESALSPFFNVVARIQNEGVGLPEDITYLVERNAKKGYAPVQAKVLSAMEFNKGDQMQVSMVNLYTTTRGGEKLYRFQDKEYQNRLWDTIKQLGR
jgi:hypothetical protein